MTLEKEPFENTVGKEENADNKHFLLFPCFLPFQIIFLLTNAFNLDQFNPFPHNDTF